MRPIDLDRFSLKARLTWVTLGVFFAGVWLLALYVSQMLRTDMEMQLGAKQFANVSFVATEVDEEIEIRIGALTTVANLISPKLFSDPGRLQALLEQRPLLANLFNDGTFITRSDGTVVASLPSSSQRIGVNYSDKASIAETLVDGKSTISDPVAGLALRGPSLIISVPLLDRDSKVKGVLAGVIHLGTPNFLDKVVKTRYGNGGGYLLISPRSNVFVTATDKSRTGQPLPASGTNVMHDKYMKGYEGYGVALNSRGVEELSAAKWIAASGWFLVSTLPTKEAFSPIQSMQFRLLLATSLLTVLAGVLTWWLTSRILARQFSPILAITNALTSQAAFHRIPAPIPIKRRDEIGKLVSGFNSLLELLAEREESLRKSELRQRLIVETMPECVKVVDTKGHLTFMNPAGLGMIEADSLEQVAGLPVLELIAPEYRDAFAQLHADVLLGESRQMKFEIVSIKGHRRWVETNAVPFAEGDHIVQLAVTRDVTERIQSDEKLRKLSLAVEQSPASILITDLQARIEFANESFYQSTGYARDDIIGSNPKILQSGKTPVATYRDMWAALTEGKEWRGELYNRKRNGEEYVESAVITPLRNEDGQITNYVAVKNDITEKKQLIADLEAHRSNLELLVLQRTEELNAAKVQADTANVAKSAFLANMSHEIRTPMNGIIGMTNILRREGVTPQQAKRINTIDTSAQHLLSIINDILDLSKVEAGKLTLEELPVSISSIIANVSSILSERANTKGIHLLTEVGHFPHNLIGDPTRLQQAILNYVANAIKFAEKGSVTIRAIQEDETDDLVRIRLEVTDTGIGISPQTMSKLFTSFEQADNSTTRKYGGTGLGLAITRRLAELMDGEAGAISEPGVGSTFWFTVKLKKFGDGTTVVIHTDVGAEAELQQCFAGQRVLVTDDDPVNLEVAVIQIEAAGLIADTASDGVEAVESAQKVLYAAIFMDMQMPNLNGMDATRQIRTIPGYRHTPIIAMTANAYAEDKAQCLDAGMSDFLIKPFVPVELFSVLLKALKQRKD